MNKPTKSSLALFSLGLALALSATVAQADERCGQGMRWDGQRCEIIVIGVVQRPQAFNVTGRGALGYTALERAPSNHRQAVVDATRRAPF
jgi:hypothetical protein